MGTPSNSKICSNIGKKGITSVGISFLIAIIWLYIEPQKKKLNGVTSGAKAVVTAVIEIDNSVLPFDSDEIKFEMLPPGHDATKIIPNAIIGVITGLNAKAMANVTAGRPTHCKMMPTITDLGFLNTSLNVCGLIPSATPNITKAKMMLTIAIPPWPKLIDTAFRASNCSFI